MVKKELEKLQNALDRRDELEREGIVGVDNGSDDGV